MLLWERDLANCLSVGFPHEVSHWVPTSTTASQALLLSSKPGRLWCLDLSCFSSQFCLSVFHIHPFLAIFKDAIWFHTFLAAICIIGLPDRLIHSLIHSSPIYCIPPWCWARDIIPTLGNFTIESANRHVNTSSSCEIKLHVWEMNAHSAAQAHREEQWLLPLTLWLQPLAWLCMGWVPTPLCPTHWSQDNFPKHHCKATVTNGDLPVALAPTQVSWFWLLESIWSRALKCSTAREV